MSVWRDAIFASSSRSNRAAIANTRVGEDSKNRGVTSMRRSVSITWSMSYFIAEARMRTSSEREEMEGSATG